MNPSAVYVIGVPVRKLSKLVKPIMPLLVLSSRALSWVNEKLPPKVMVCLPRLQTALAEGIQRFWKMPVKAPCDAAVEPMFRPALNTALEFKGEALPRSSTIVIPGKAEEPKALMPTDWGVKGWASVL